MTIGIIDVGLGNIGSLSGALYSQGWDIELIDSPEKIKQVTHLILPGVGSFSVAMERLERSGLSKAIKFFAQDGMPILGICLGMQLLADKGVEGGLCAGLGLIHGDIRPFGVVQPFRFPHVGWNVMNKQASHPVLSGIKAGADFYFVHGYHFTVRDKSDIVGLTDYSLNFASVIANRNVLGVQFHPEKSQKNGLRLLDNFCNWSGGC